MHSDPSLKYCPRCDEKLPLSSFHKNRTKPDGLASYCKPCNRAEQAPRRQTPEWREKWRKYRTEDPRGVAAFRRYYQKSKKQKAAQVSVMTALRSGRITKAGSCEECGSTERIEGHHDNYDKPLKVRWLCRLCHAAWHAENGPGLNAR